MNNGDHPAAPCKVWTGIRETGYESGIKCVEDVFEPSPGLTKREHFAGLALQGLLAAGVSNSTAAVEMAVTRADDLLMELER